MGSAFFVSQIPDYSNSKIVLSSKDKEKSTSLIQKAARFIDVKSARSRPAIFLILIRVAMALAFHIFNTIWTVSLKSRFDFGPSDHGKFMSFIGLIYALSQGVLSKWILASVGRKGSVYVLQLCCVALGVGRYVAFQVESLLVVYIMFAFIVTAFGGVTCENSSSKRSFGGCCLFICVCVSYGAIWLQKEYLQLLHNRIFR